ncbi:glycosyltransferase [Carboxylicivirga marina]|uniref:glycosyltransferase n=1 Tax=Carboxylicivirga marina TaxID=2800988 RepID=UPI00259A54CD|nr:glycosyltransferase [uncultured Carboxylicivirga sp.]
MKHVGIVIRSLKPGGAEKQSALLANVLCSDYRVYVFYQYDDFSPFNEALLLHKNIIKVHLTGSWPRKILKLRKLIVQQRIQCLFSYLSSDNLIASIASIGINRCQNYGGIRSSLLPKHKFIILKLLHKYLQKASVFNNYSGQKLFIQQGFVESKSIVIHNAIDINNTKQSNNNKEVINILSVGRFVKAKDYQTALLAIKTLKTISHKPLRYFIIGYGSEEENIRRIVTQEKLTESVEIVINPSNTEDYYKKAHIYLCTSIFEGLSNSIMEALNNKLPVVATNVGDNNQLVIHERSGFLTPIKNYQTIADHLIQLINAPALMLSMGKNGYTHLKENYSVHKFKERYIQLIENQIDN